MSKNLKPEFEQGFVEIPITYEEIFTLIRALDYSRAAFEHLVQESTAQGDEKLAEVFKARADLCKMFADKFNNIAKVGHPLDNNKH